MPRLNKEKRRTTGEWEYEEIQYQKIQEIDSKESWRHLGNFQDNECHQSATKSEIHNDIDEIIKYMSKRMLTSEGTLVGYKVKCLPRILYKTKHANLTEQQLQNAQIKINGLLKTKLRIGKNTPDMLLYGHRSGGGLEFPHLWDETNMHKLSILQTGLSKSNTDLQHVLKGAINRLHKWAQVSVNSIQNSNIMKIIKLDEKEWISSLWTWMLKHNHTIKLPKVKEKQTQGYILETYIQYEISKLNIDEEKQWKLWQEDKSYNNKIPNELKNMSDRINKLAQALRKNSITYVQELGDENITTKRQQKNQRVKIKHKFNYLANQNNNNRWVEMLKDAGIIQVGITRHNTQLTLAHTTITTHQDADLRDDDDIELWEQLQQSQLAEIICADDNTIQEMFDHEIEEGKLQTYTDGSVKTKDHHFGSYGWIIPATTIESAEDIIYSGGGREKINKTQKKYDKKDAQNENDAIGQKMSSTRMEAMAILSLHIALEILDPEHKLEVRNGIDSKSAMQTYNKLQHLQNFEILNLHNHDVWQMIKSYQTIRMIEMHHVRAHMDKHIQDAAKEKGIELTIEEAYQKLTQEERGNFHADEQAEFMHDSGEWLPQHGLTNMYEVATYYKHSLINVSLMQWMRDTVQYHNTKQYWYTHPDVIDGIQINWDSMSSVTTAHHKLHKRISFMKILWKSYAYNHKRMCWKLIPPSDNKCIFCNKRVETQEHILTECMGSHISEIKNNMYSEIAEALTTAMLPKKGGKRKNASNNEKIT